MSVNYRLRVRKSPITKKPRIGTKIMACLMSVFLSVKLERKTLTTRFETTVDTVKTLNIGTPRPATVVVLNIKQFNFTMK